MNQQAAATGGLGERRYDLDWVRIGAFAVLILYHVGMYYVTWDWHVKSPHASMAIEPLMMLSSPWRLSLLFMVSGVASAYLMVRMRAGFLAQRSVRLLVPLVFGVLVIVPPQSYLEVVEKLGYAGSFGEFWARYLSGYRGFCRGSDCLLIPTWNHLWFVAYLWVYTLVLYVSVRWTPALTHRARAFAERNLAGSGILIWPILYLALVRALLVHRFPPSHMLINDWYNHASYLPAFFAGFVLAGTRAPWEAMQRLRWHALGFAILGWSFLCAYFGVYAADDAVIPELARTAQRFVFGAEQWLAIVAVSGFARLHFTHDSAARRYLTTAIFPVYILHQTVIVVVAHSLKPANLNAGVESLLLILTTGATCFLGYELIRRVPLLRPLFGLAIESRPKNALGKFLPARTADDVH